MNNYDPKELIQKFLEESLSTEELDVFRKHYEQDPDFAAEVKLHTDMEIALLAAKQLGNKKREEAKSKKQHTQPLYQYLAMAAALLLLLSIPLYFLFQPPTAGELAQSYFMHQRLYDLRNGKEPSGQEVLFEKAHKAYKNKQTGLAISFLRQATEAAPESAEYFYTLADLYFISGQSDSALYYYKQGRQVHGGTPSALWNETMALLLVGEKDHVQTLLEKRLKDEAASHRKEAKELLKKLERTR